MADDSLEEEFQNPNRAAATTTTAPSLLFMSFGWKYGPPTDTLINYNLKKLPHPPDIRNKTGLDKEMQRNFFALATVAEFYTDLVDQIKVLLQDPIDSPDGQVVIGIGCHSGKHRSVCTVMRLAEEQWRSHLPYEVDVAAFHRDISKKSSDAQQNKKHRGGKR